ncbi:hypothetical protein [Pseudobacteroides cellulosolvens]|uniref:Uncharacterized protein n=1 Tax=Pseudobacteroides cellulosolvens ATCC 35603 = DSM 2933 TaxID=398512 RepID=A0A0L6JGI9_9FIRM|nr:hypothetical protein [Pseudobacteroides cellulosolvens]KNY24828.1 hypothetical protein Bccel_0085 [Pseudobacteroides cellulosolvens ATCC 35603 = DSM 2933]
MNKEELLKISAIQREIEIIKIQISSADYRYTADSVRGSENVFPYVERSFSVKGYDYDSYYAKLNRLQSKLKRKLEELMDERDKVLEYIETVPDSIMRQILMLKYINGMTWEQIGMKIGYSARSVRRKHTWFFTKN